VENSGDQWQNSKITRENSNRLRHIQRHKLPPPPAISIHCYNDYRQSRSLSRTNQNTLVRRGLPNLRRRGWGLI
jgi:hypothetical protein